MLSEVVCGQRLTNNFVVSSVVVKSFRFKLRNRGLQVRVLPGVFRAVVSSKSLARPPSKPNAVRRGANHHKVRRQAWFARGLTAGRLSLAQHLSARIKREPYFWRQPRQTAAASMPVGDEPTNSIIL